MAGTKTASAGHKTMFRAEVAGAGGEAHAARGAPEGVRGRGGGARRGRVCGVTGHVAEASVFV